MSSRKVPLTFTFRRHGAHPPLFVAGSFSDPPWQPLEMDASIDQHGDLIFTKQVMVDESSEVQYKFRHASGDWWALDPDAETVTDEHGNVNSLLLSPSKYAVQETTLGKEMHGSKARDAADCRIFNVPSDAKTSPNDINTKTYSTKIDSLKGLTEKDELRRLSFTPIEEVADTAAEVADTASHLDDDDLEVDGSDALPMLSHECFASPSDSPTFSYKESEPQHNKPNDSESPDQSSMDYDDPRLEHFPSDRSSIIATMRRLSTTLDADPTMVYTVPLSPITTAKPCSSSGPSPRNSLSLEEINTTHKQAGDMNRHPTSITGRKHSLQSIAEGEEAPSGTGTLDDVERLNTPTEYIGPVEKCDLSLTSSDTSNEDEGIDMGNVSPKSKTPIRLKEPPHGVLLAVTIDKTKTHETPPTEEHTSVASRPTMAGESNDEQSCLQKPTHAYASQEFSARGP
ncbi:hypothetical protein F4859DRAFT_427054 [Xylaria cf. heliscus]|nr:hypothetical protein F4859DRAFT_427054 [Xylaria cf. heliscus]